jgi:hypothetical protein
MSIAKLLFLCLRHAHQFEGFRPQDLHRGSQRAYGINAAVAIRWMQLSWRGEVHRLVRWHLPTGDICVDSDLRHRSGAGAGKNATCSRDGSRPGAPHPACGRAEHLGV